MIEANHNFELTAASLMVNYEGANIKQYLIGSLLEPNTGILMNVE